MMNRRIAPEKMLSAVLGVAALGLSTMLAGCGLGSGEVSDTHVVGTAASVTGSVHGGQQPVAFSTVQLWSAGTTGYGSQGTLLATTTSSDPDGAFSFTKSGTNGASSGSGTTWACPATTDDPQLYLLAIGGNSSGDHQNASGHLNSAIALMAALGPCSGVTNSTTVIIDEVSTVAAVYALAPYMKQGSTAGSVTVGTTGANTSGSTPQGAIGLNNAVLGVANLTSAATTHTGASTGNVSTISITATPEAGKVNTIANILASCINSTTSSSSVCLQLMAAATPKTGTTQPLDTIQAAYNMATNPTDAGTFTSCGTGTSAPTTNIGCLFALPSSTPPFQPVLAAAPTDWTIGVTYSVASTSGTCSSNGFGGAKFFDSPTRAAVDANGNVYIVNGSASKAAIVEISPNGTPLGCVIPGLNTTTAQTYGQGITIDPSGNVFANFAHATFTNSIAEWPAGTSTVYTATPAAEAYGITSDLDGNVFYTIAANSGTVYEFVAPTTGTLNVSTATPVVANTGFYNATSGSLSNFQTDSQGRLFGIAATSYLLGDYPLTASISAYSVSNNVVTFTASNSFSSGQTVTISGLTTGTQFNGQRMTITAASASSFSASFTAANAGTTTDSGSARATGASAYTTAFTAGNSASYGLAIGASNVAYSGTACCNSASGLAKAERFVPAATAVAGAATASAQFVGGSNGTRSVAVDGAGTMWMGGYWPQTTSGVYGVVSVTPTISGTTVTYTGNSPAGTAPSGGCSASTGCPVGGGFQKADFQAIADIVVDPSGNVWALNTGTSPTGTISVNGTTVTEIIGAATPIVTPLSLAAKNGTLGTRP
ncbi:beta strand repeat-containing protein [Granulicella cerasi]|uniref:Beta strand repeat-containing protein n=1 Tax=Granulicella cerasi TaxID=741063 RepID=A0ABW1Z7A4_9BACT|nr:hypothetical protein [Granulicella cerasi]